MAFLASGLAVIGVLGMVGTGSGSVKRLISYSTNDTRAQIETDAYFDSVASKLETGDVLIASYDIDGTEGCALYMVTATDTDVALTRATADRTAIAGVGALAGTLTGSVDGTLADVADIALSTSNTYTDAAVNAAVNTAIAAVNLQLKELQTKVNALIAAA